MGEDKKETKITVDNAGLMGTVWMIGWLFTIGYAHLPTGKAFLALVLWPYYLGVTLR